MKILELDIVGLHIPRQTDTDISKYLELLSWYLLSLLLTSMIRDIYIGGQGQCREHFTSATVIQGNGAATILHPFLS